jgi:hypothetical protein
MSTPAKVQDRVDDPSSQSPQWMRQSPPVVPGPSALPTALPAAPEIANSPPMAPGIGGPNLDLPQRLRPFEEGAGAVKDVPGWWRLGPRLVSRPRVRTLGRKAPVRIDALAFTVMLSAIAVLCAAVLLTFLDQERKQASAIVGMLTPLLEGSSRTGTRAQPARLVIKSQKGFTNEPLPLGVSLDHASGGETVTLAGLATGTMLSAGTPLGLSGWQVPARDVGSALAYAPKDFAGTMDVAIDLHSATDRLLDSRAMRLEWTPRKDR